MAVVHIVLFKLKESLTQDEKREVSFEVISYVDGTNV